MKKIVTSILIVVLCFAFAATAFAVSAGEERVTIGANLDQNQVAQIYSDFGIEQGSVKQITVTNDEERSYLSGLVPDEKIGNVALSCIYIKTLDSGSGITVSTKNIKWCTSDMYINALVTAGITDAEIKVSAPHEVTGTAALTGIYKAYEDITGVTLQEDAKEAGATELVITGELAEYIGDQDATELVNQLKQILDQTQNMTDDEVRTEIRNIASNIGVEITDEQVEQLLQLCRQLEGLDTNDLLARLDSVQNAMKGISDIGNTFSDIGQKVVNFFGEIGKFFSNLFGGNN